MATLKQEQEVLEGISPYPSSRRSSRIAAIDLEDIPDHQVQEIVPYPSSTTSSGGHSKRISPDDLEDNSPPSINFHQNQKSGWRTFLSYVGPGFLISISYIDPGNLETGMQAGANYGYELLWVILIGFIFAFIIQSLAANLGICTGKHLSELCKLEYPKYVKIALWLLAEIAVIAADLIEVIGTAFALNILIHIPVWAGVIMTGGSTLLLLGLQKYGVRKLEISIEVIQFALAGYFFAEMGYVKPPAKDVMKGLFVPKLSGQGAIANAIALIGATITPYNLFLHSGIVLSRKAPDSVRGINDACRYLLIESGFALFVALLINIAIVSVTSSICMGHNLTPEDADRCNNLTLDSASFLLKNVLGKSSSLVYGIALLASGQSTTLTSTYAGQFIMQGFLDLRMKKWIRNLITRCTAIMPSLIVAIVGGSSGAGRLIIIASMILSFELPFALIPLIKFSSSTAKMGPHKNSIYIIVISWILAVLLIGINVYYLSTSFVDWLIHNHLPKIGKVFIGIVVFPLMAIYILAIIYMTFRKDTVVTYTETKESDPNDPAKMESGQVKSGSLDQVPYREDLADVPFPE